MDQGVMYAHYRTPNNSQADPSHQTWGDYTSKKRGLPNTASWPAGGWGTLMYAARSYHPGGVCAVFAEGSVHFISDSTSSSLWTALGSINGGESEMFTEF